MEHKFINVTPVCGSCDGQLCIVEIQIDLVNCLYIIHSECIMCGEENYHILSLEDFIDISRLVGGQDEEEK